MDCETIAKPPPDRFGVRPNLDSSAPVVYVSRGSPAFTQASVPPSML